MTSTTETGHAVNVANFEDLISLCQSYGSAYNPSKNGLKLPQLQTQLASVQANMEAHRAASMAYGIAIGVRTVAFEELKKLTPRLVNALNVTDASKDLVKKATAIRKRIQGRRSGEKPEDKVAENANRTLPPLDTTPVTVAVPTSKSVSHVSFDNVVDQFASLILILSAEPTYVPNEPELQIASLNARLTNLKNLNMGVMNAYGTVVNTREARDNSLYDGTVGLCNMAKQVKDYTKATFGASSMQYKQLTRLYFKGKRSV